MNGNIVKKLDTRHPDSQKLLTVRKRCEDVREGQEAIHKAGEKYLPRLSGQNDKEYAAYKSRAVFYGAMSRTVDAFIGMILRVPPIVDKQSALLDDVTGEHCSLTEFTDEVLEHALVDGFGGLLVEYPPMPDGVLTIAQAQQLGSRPYLALFDYDTVLNWKLKRGAVVQVVLEEHEEIAISQFESSEQCIYRVLDIDDQGHYRQRKFIKSAKKTDEFIQQGDDIYPVKNGQRLTEIPFYFIGEPDELPPLIDLVDLNISHYRTTADLENGCHYTGIPQPWLAGVQLDEGKTLSVGGVNAWAFPDPQAKAGYLEFTGQGLGALEKRLEIKEKQMAALGAKMLSDSVTAETATGSNLKSAGEFSVLAKLADRTAKTLSRACSFMLDWAGEASSVSVALNKDYLPAKMTPQELQAAVQAWQAGAISDQTLFYNLKQGEIVAEGTKFEDEQARIAENPPGMLNAAD